MLLQYGIETPKTKLAAMECRGLCLHTKTFEIVGKGFTRFFNFGEHGTLTRRFDWSDFETFDKEDGTLILLYYFEGEWITSTKQTFCDVEPFDCKITWRQMVEEVIDLTNPNLDQNYTYCFELCTPYVQHTTIHKQSKMFLLAAFNNHDCHEMTYQELKDVAVTIGCDLVGKVECKSVEEIQKSLAEKGNQYEGVVVKDKNNMRLKIKNADWLAMFKLRGNNGKNLLQVDTILRLFLNAKDDLDEQCLYSPLIADRVQRVLDMYTGILYRSLLLFEAHKFLQSQKEFALAIKGELEAPLLFSMRKFGDQYLNTEAGFDTMVKLVKKGLGE